MQFLTNNKFVSIITSKPEFNHSLWMIGGQVVVSIAAFTSTIAIANLVPEEVVGSYRFIIALYASVSVFALIGLFTALQQSVAAGMSGSVHLAKAKKQQYGLIITIFFIGAALYFYFVSDQQYLWIPLLASAFLLPLTETYSLYASYLNGASKFKETAISLSVERLITATVLVMVAFYTPTVLALVLGYLLSHLVVRYFLYIRALRIEPPNSELDSGMMRYAKHLTGMSLISVITAQLDKYILFFFFGPAALASFWVASIIPQEFGRFLGVVMGTFFPRLVQTHRTDTVLFVRKLFFFILIGVAFLTILYGYVAEFFFLIFLPEYVEFFSLSIILMFAYVFIPHQMVWNIFTAKKEVKELYFYGVAEPFLTILVYVIFIPIYGIFGLAYALCARTLIMNSIALLVLYKYKI